MNRQFYEKLAFTVLAVLIAAVVALAIIIHFGAA